MGETPKAPRFHAYLERVENRSVLIMPRIEWQKIKPVERTPVPVEITDTPMAAVAQRASIVATVAVQFSSSPEIHIYRYDQRDAPNVYNLDRYSVWEDLPSSRSYEQIVAAASTNDDENLRSFMRENVFLVKLSPGPDHWLPTLPSSVVAVFNSSLVSDA
jgi:hypothetical protein